MSDPRIHEEILIIQASFTETVFEEENEDSEPTVSNCVQSKSILLFGEFPYPLAISYPNLNNLSWQISYLANEFEEVQQLFRSMVKYSLLPPRLKFIFSMLFNNLICT